MIHYHGTPLTPRSRLETLSGKHFCVPFSDRRDADWAQQHAQSVMWDNGAYSAYTQQKATDWRAFYDWVGPRLGPVHWAVIPDVIGGGSADNDALIKEWPYSSMHSAPVWHLDEPISRLLDLCQGWPRVCFGSSGAYKNVGDAAWAARVDDAFNALSRAGPLPWLHMLRGLKVCGRRWPFASADSANVARNSGPRNKDARQMMDRIDAVQSPVQWAVGPADS